MKFRKSCVYTALNADELEIGNSVILSDTVSELKAAVKKGSSIQKLIAIRDEDTLHRFIGDQEYSVHSLAYLVEPDADIEYQPYYHPFYSDINFVEIIIRSLERPAGKICFIFIFLIMGLLFFDLFK